MLFDLHFMSHLTLYNVVHNIHAVLTFSMYVGDVTVAETLSASYTALHAAHAVSVFHASTR